MRIKKESGNKAQLRGMVSIIIISFVMVISIVVFFAPEEGITQEAKKLSEDQIDSAVKDILGQKDTKDEIQDSERFSEYAEYVEGIMAALEKAEATSEKECFILYPYGEDKVRGQETLYTQIKGGGNKLSITLKSKETADKIIGNLDRTFDLKLCVVAGEDKDGNSIATNFFKRYLEETEGEEIPEKEKTQLETFISPTEITYNNPYEEIIVNYEGVEVSDENVPTYDWDMKKKENEHDGKRYDLLFKIDSKTICFFPASFSFGCGGNQDTNGIDETCFEEFLIVEGMGKQRKEIKQYPICS